MFAKHLAVLAVCGWVAASAAASELRFVDDRDEALIGVITVCRTVGLSQHCEDVRLDGSAIAVDRFDLLQVEGPQHGPARFASRTGDSTLRIPRKTPIAVNGLRSDHQVVLSLYSLDDPSFRRPAHRFDLPMNGRLSIPSGSWLASFAERGWAPDLQPLEALPGEPKLLRYRRQAGWSAVVKVVSAANGEPVNDARVELLPTPGYGARAPLRGRSVPSGLAVFSGIGFELADAAVEHPDLVARCRCAKPCRPRTGRSS